jgi:hypothetical protein
MVTKVMWQLSASGREHCGKDGLGEGAGSHTALHIHCCYGLSIKRPLQLMC